MIERRQALDGPLPIAVVAVRRAAAAARPTRCSPSSTPGRAARRCRPPWPSPACCATCAATRASVPRVVPIIPDEARTFGMDALFKEVKIYASPGQLLRAGRLQADALLHRGQDGQILEEGITEAGGMANFTAAGTAYATRGVPMIPFFIFYSMFGFQRVGDLIWALGRRPGPGLPARRHRRAHHAARRGPAAPGRPQPGAGVDRARRAGLRPGVRLRDGRHRRARHRAHVRPRARPDDIFYYLTLYNENYQMPARPEGVSPRESSRACTAGPPPPDGLGAAR